MNRDKSSPASNSAEQLTIELDRQFDSALLRDGIDELIIPLWDGAQYIGGERRTGPKEKLDSSQQPEK